MEIVNSSVNIVKRDDKRKIEEISAALKEKFFKLGNCVHGTVEGDKEIRRLKQQIRCLFEKCNLYEMLKRNPEYDKNKFDEMWQNLNNKRSD